MTRQTAEDRGIDGPTMTGEQMRAIRVNAGLSIYELAALLRYRDIRSLRKIEDGKLPLSGPIQLCMEAIRDGKIDPDAELQ